MKAGIRGSGSESRMRSEGGMGIVIAGRDEDRDLRRSLQGRSSRPVSFL